MEDLPGRRKVVVGWHDGIVGLVFATQHGIWRRQCWLVFAVRRRHPRRRQLTCSILTCPVVPCHTSTQHSDIHVNEDGCGPDAPARAMARAARARLQRAVSGMGLFPSSEEYHASSSAALFRRGRPDNKLLFHRRRDGSDQGAILSPSAAAGRCGKRLRIITCCVGSRLMLIRWVSWMQAAQCRVPRVSRRLIPFACLT